MRRLDPAGEVVAGHPIAPVFLCHYPRWPAVQATFADLRLACRHAVRIVAVDCGSCAVLLRAVAHARARGFLVAEGRGTGSALALIARARLAETQVTDPAVELSFAGGDSRMTLVEEVGCPADILLWHGTRARHNRSGGACRPCAAVVDHGGERNDRFP